MGLIVPRNPLAYPGGNPGFNPSHFAGGRGIRYSAVAQNGNLTSLLTGAPAAVNGAITGLTAPIGPVVKNVTSLAYLSVPALNETPAAVTMAAIVIPLSSISFGFLFNNDNVGSGATITALILKALVPTLIAGSGAITVSGVPALSLGVPYFIAISYNGLVENNVVVNLATGAIWANAAAVTRTIGTPTGSSYNIAGVSVGGSQQLDGNLAAVMYAINNYLSLAQLAQWGGAAPYDFWYPPTQLLTTIASAPQSAPTILLARQSLVFM